jgi:hypothetical protein
MSFFLKKEPNGGPGTGCDCAIKLAKVFVSCFQERNTLAPRKFIEWL